MTKPQIDKQLLNEMFDFIVQFKKANDGVAPSIREIMDGCYIATTSRVHSYLKELENDGKIVIEKEKTRFIKVIGGEWRFTEWHKLT